MFRNKFLAVLFIILMMFFTGCSKKQPVETPAEKPAAGGTLTIGSLYEPNTLNPLFSDLLATAEVGSLIFSGLIKTDDKGEWIPDLASDVPTLRNGEVSQDGLTVMYKLRQGVTWHDGVPFTSDDVKFTWQMIMNRKINVLNREGYDKIASVDTPDQYTVILHFKEHYAPYLTLFSNIMPRHALDTGEDINKAAFNRAPVGTGPFKFKAWRVAEAIELDANPAYFRGKPKLDGITFKVIPDQNILLTQLKAGELNIVTNINFTQLDQVKAIDNVNTILTPSMIWEHLDFNLDSQLFQDARVRQAIALSIDRQAIISNILKNAASPALADQPPVSWAYNPTLVLPARDINAARELLAQAGWAQGPDGILVKNGRKLAFVLATTANNKVREAVAQSIAQQLKEVGIAVEIRPIEAKTFFNEVLRTRKFETALYAWVEGMDPDNLSMWHSRKIPNQANGYDGQNYPGWRNAEIDALTESGVRTVDVEARKQIYFRIQDLIIQEYPVIPLYFRVNIAAVRKNVANYRPNPTPAGDFWNAWEWGITANDKNK